MKRYMKSLNSKSCFWMSNRLQWILNVLSAEIQTKRAFF